MKVKSFLHKVDETENGDVKVGEDNKGEVEVAKSPLPTLLGTSFKRVEGNARETTWGLNDAG
jgi:hypothetical protein